MGFLVFGYVIGSRGFAQVRPVSVMPLFLSELGLGIGAALVLMRGALMRRLPLRRDWLNGLLLLWFLLGSGRIFWDVRIFGFLALRDFAMVYYVLYFFVAQSIAGHEPSRRLLNWFVLATFAVLPVTASLAAIFPDFFLSNLLVEGVPLIFYKADLLATFLYAGFLVLLPARDTGWRSDWWRWSLALLSLAAGADAGGGVRGRVAGRDSLLAAAAAGIQGHQGLRDLRGGGVDRGRFRHAGLPERDEQRQG